MDRLLGMEVFVAVVDTGSFTAAAELFRLSAPMVGKHIRELESRLGVRLLTRTTRRQSLTEAGRDYYLRCKNILEEIKAAETGAEALRAAPRGNLRINAPVSFGSLKLAPAIAHYLAAYSDVSVELTLNDRIVDIVDEGYDVAIRIGALNDSNLIARPLTAYRMVICAASSYLERAGIPVSPADLVRHQCLGFTHWKKRGGWRLQRSEISESMLPKSRFQSNNGQALRTAALAGFGIVMQPEILLGDDISNGLLIGVLKDFWPTPQPMHLIYPNDRQAVPKLTTFVDFILSQFGRR